MSFKVLERREIASQLGLGVVHLNQLMGDPDCPRLENMGKIGNTNIYNPDTVAEWMPLFRAWRDQMPVQRAAKRAADMAAYRRDQERRFAEIDARKGVPTPEHAVMLSQQQAYLDAKAELDRLDSGTDYRL